MASVDRQVAGRQSISHSVAHYLKAVHECVEEFGYSRVTDIAQKLNVKKSSVSIQVGRLEKRGLITVDKNKHIRLSSLGRSLNTRCQETKDLLYDFFHNILRIPSEAADREACLIEHQLSQNTVTALASFLGTVPREHSNDA